MRNQMSLPLTIVALVFAGTAMAVEPGTNSAMVRYHFTAGVNDLRCLVWPMSCANETITGTPPISNAQCPVGYSNNPLDRRLYESERFMNMAQHVLEIPKQAAKMAKAAQNTANRAADAHLGIVDAVSNGAENAAPTIEQNSQRFYEWGSYGPVLGVVAANGCWMTLAVLTNGLWLLLVRKMMAKLRELETPGDQLSVQESEMLAFHVVMHWITPELHLLDGEDEESRAILNTLYEVVMVGPNYKVRRLRADVRKQLAIEFLKQGFDARLALDPSDVKPPVEMVRDVLTTCKQTLLQKHYALQKIPALLQKYPALLQKYYAWQQLKKQKIAIPSQ